MRVLLWWLASSIADKIVTALCGLVIAPTQTGRAAGAGKALLREVDRAEPHAPARPRALCRRAQQAGEMRASRVAELEPVELK